MLGFIKNAETGGRKIGKEEEVHFICGFKRARVQSNQLFSTDIVVPMWHVLQPAVRGEVTEASYVEVRQGLLLYLGAMLPIPWCWKVTKIAEQNRAWLRERWDCLANSEYSNPASAAYHYSPLSPVGPTGRNTYCNM